MATLYQSRVYHRRSRPKVHELSYDLWAMKVDLDALESLEDQNLLGGSSPLSVDFRDFGPRDGSALKPWFQARLREAGFDSNGPLEFLFLPRLHGRGFSPLSVWSSPDALLFEVHNTAGEAHSYLIARAELKTHSAWKRLWVSPFSAMHGRYTFGYGVDGSQMNVRVTLHDRQGPNLVATLGGPGEPLTTAALAKVIKAPGIAGRRTFFTILWQALKIRRKGLNFRWGPFAPKATVTRASTSPSHLGKSLSGGNT